LKAFELKINYLTADEKQKKKFVGKI